MDERIKRVLQWQHEDEQHRAKLEDDVRAISEQIIFFADFAINPENEKLRNEAKNVTIAIANLMEQLDSSANFLENDKPTILGRMFVHKVLSVVGKINEYLSVLNNEPPCERRKQITAICTAYCKALCLYARKLAV